MTQRLFIGFTGHRPNRLVIGADGIRSRMRDVLTSLGQAALQQNAENKLIAISPLAEGSDRLFADVALELGYELWALLPLKSSDYEQTFQDQATTPNYRTLLQRSEKIIERPGTLADTEAAYAALGHDMVDRSRLLVVVWDGQPAAGKGGTPEVIEYAIQKNCPVVWINAAVDQAPLLLRSHAMLVTSDLEVLSGLFS